MQTEATFEGGEATNWRALTRWAGVLYLIIIVLGVSSEVGVRGRLIVAEDAAATAANLTASAGLYRAGFFADLVMCLSDVALAVLLYVLLSRVQRTLAMVALFFRLTQTAILGGGLLLAYAPLVLLEGAAAGPVADPAAESQALFFTQLHALGYDLGLVFFGVHCWLLGVLIVRSGFLPRPVGWLVFAAGCVYVAGSAIRFGLPAASASFAPAYAVCLVAELALGLWLLIRGANPPVGRARQVV